ncbi:hypothetical protein pdam_00023821 [Pocillopora damicornis]|uniref:Uncharacterized protein n=1 Tax=Pocillopora damicornis TaxID=46731 RepID=A0A3M6V4M6_POCDA|nr:hypothetical protein pdam_00023821 [Pocillopora damicornis]
MSEAPFVPPVFLSICLTKQLPVLPCILFTQLTLFCSKSTHHLYPVRWIQMTPSTVCFGARDDSYGFFRTAKAGNIITFKLTYKSGYVTCHSSNPSYQSKWGCLWNRLIPNQMATLITDKNRNLLLPKSDFLSDYWGCKFYSLPWATTESPQLLFDNFSTPLAVETKQEFQIWYSEDLFKWGYGNNGYEKTLGLQYFVLS